MHTIRRLRPQRQGVLIPYDGSIAIRAFDEKSSGPPVAEKVDGEILCMAMKFVTSIRQKRIPNFVFVRHVFNVALNYHPVKISSIPT
jgi:hypothetical protein